MKKMAEEDLVTVYHQSQSKEPFDEFRQRGDKGYKKAPYSQVGEGVYFSTNKDLVQEKYNKNEGQLIEAKVDPSKFLDLGEFDAMYFDGRKVHYGEVVVDNFKRNMRGEPLLPEPDIILHNISKKAKQWLLAQGYEGVQGMKGDMWSAPEYVVFDVSKIRR